MNRAGAAELTWSCLPSSLLLFPSYPLTDCTAFLPFCHAMYTVNFAFAIFFLKAKMIFFLLFSLHPHSLSHHFLRLVAILTYTAFFSTQFFLSEKEAPLTSTRIPRHLAFHFIDAKSLQNRGSDMRWWRRWWWFFSSSSTSVHTRFVFHLFALANWRKYRLSKRNISARKVCNRYLLTYSKCMTVTFFFFYSLFSFFPFSLIFCVAPLFSFLLFLWWKLH